AKCSFKLTGDATATAVFKAIPPGKDALSVIVSGDGSVSGDVACHPGSCVKALPDGRDVTLTAIESGKLPFKEWTSVHGREGQASRKCTFALTRSRSVTAVFATNTFAVTVAVNDEKEGSVSGGDITCPGDCETTLAPNTPVALTAKYVDGYAFDHWEGGPC